MMHVCASRCQCFLFVIAKDCPCLHRCGETPAMRTEKLRPLDGVPSSPAADKHSGKHCIANLKQKPSREGYLILKSRQPGFSRKDPQE